jgi:hypothetical protein
MLNKIKYVELSIGLVIFLLSFGASTSIAAPSACLSVKTLTSGVLWKPENVHGGRGGSFLLGCQVHSSQWPANTRPLTLLDQNGKTIGKLGLYDPGHHAYGRRYYMKVSGGSFTNVSVLKSRARKAGSPNMYIQGGSRGCWKVSDATRREGSLSPVAGNGRC